MEKTPRMVWIERGWFVVAIVLPLALALYAAVAPSSAELAPVVIAYVAFTALFMPVSGWSYLGDRLRERPPPEQQARSDFALPIGDWAASRLRLLRLVERIAPAVAAVHAVLVVLMLRGQAPAWAGIAAVSLAVLIARWIGSLLLRDESRQLERAIAQGASLAVSEAGLRLPLCLCIEPTRRLGHARGLVELELGWAVISRVEVRDGPRGGHWLIEVSGDAVSLACTSPVLYGLSSPFVGLQRIFGEREAEALAALRAHLSDERIVLRAARTEAP